MDRGQLLRRLVHISTPAYLIYYFIPDPLVGGIDNRVSLLVLYVAVMSFELYRLLFEPRIIGMRDYEKDQISAAAWAATAITLAFILFPIEYAVPALIGMALVDPLIGELRFRASHLYPILPAIVYLMITYASLELLISEEIWKIAMASLLATFLAITVERTRSRYVDDDFLMIVAPLIGLALALGI